MSDLAALINEWWQVAAFVSAGVFAFIAGRERQRWRTHQLGEKIDHLSAQTEDLQTRLQQVENDANKDGRLLVSIDATQKQMLEALGSIRGELANKKDRRD